MSGTLKAWRTCVLRFGLVSVPVSLVPAKDGEGSGRHYFDGDGNRVRQSWTADGETIAKDVRLAFADADGNPLDVEVPTDDGSDKGIRLSAFVSEGTLDPVFYDSAYILYAKSDGADGLGVLAAVLRESPFMMFAGDARFTDRTRSVVIRWSEGLGCLVLHTLTFAAKLRADAFRIAGESLATPTAELLAQGEMFADTLSDEFVPASYDPLDALVRAALPDGEAADDAPSVSAGNILDTLRADMERRADETNPRRKSSRAGKGTKSTK